MKKLSLKNAEGLLSRKEMKNIMAGSGSGGTCIAACNSCTQNSECCSTVCSTDQPGCGGGKRCLR